MNARSFREDFVPKTDYSELLNFGVDLSSLPFSLSMPPKPKSHFGKGTINQPCTTAPRSEGRVPSGWILLQLLHKVLETLSRPCSTEQNNASH